MQVRSEGKVRSIHFLIYIILLFLLFISRAKSLLS